MINDKGAAGYGLCLFAEEMSKIGLLCLKKGVIIGILFLKNGLKKAQWSGCVAAKNFVI